MKIVLIACASKKLDQSAKARDLYISQLFKLGIKYAYSLDPDKIFILSAKYGLLDLETEIFPYNVTLNTMSKMQRQEWAGRVLDRLSKETNLQTDEFVFLAGKKYREYLIPRISSYQVPMKGLGIGKQLKFLTEKVR
ncbi:MAG: DUF6884 domain-containing protein [archaeon]